MVIATFGRMEKAMNRRRSGIGRVGQQPGAIGFPTRFVQAKQLVGVGDHQRFSGIHIEQKPGGVGRRLLRAAEHGEKKREQSEDDGPEKTGSGHGEENKCKKVQDKRPALKTFVPVPDPATVSALSTTTITTAANQTLDWGRTDYVSARQRQEELVGQRNAAEVGDTLVFTEHDPVYTLGVRKGAEQHLVWDADELQRRQITVEQTNRGGDITYHGPGQIVGYPIVNLATHKDLHAYLRLLEQVLINTVGTFGLAAGRRAGKTGIWLGARKIAAIGVAVKKWTTYHGFALNVNADLTPFGGIIPCGITDGTVTSMKIELGHDLDLAEVKHVLASEFWRLFGGFLAHGNPPAS
jgi:lipoyl(octanoyl) transferase